MWRPEEALYTVQCTLALPWRSAGAPLALRRPECVEMEARSACACQLFNRGSDTRIHSAFTQLYEYHGISVDDTTGATYAVQVRATRSIDMGSATWFIAWRSTCVQA